MIYGIYFAGYNTVLLRIFFFFFSCVIHPMQCPLVSMVNFQCSCIITRSNNSHSRLRLGILGAIIFKNKRNTAPERATEGERITIVSNLDLLVVLAC